MAKNDDRGERLGSLELEPKDGKAAATAGRAVFHPNTRAKGNERRTKYDERRDDVRLQEPRRKGSRRPKEAWDGITPKR
jgi:hypothetical protein